MGRPRSGNYAFLDSYSVGSKRQYRLNHHDQGCGHFSRQPEPKWRQQLLPIAPVRGGGGINSGALNNGTTGDTIGTGSGTVPGSTPSSERE
jgi:hypothetical protein